jgi:hypothetical protein
MPEDLRQCDRCGKEVALSSPPHRCEHGKACELGAFDTPACGLCHWNRLKVTMAKHRLSLKSPDELAAMFGINLSKIS